MEQTVHFGYGYKFQSKLIAALLSDQKFLLKTLDILKVEYFDNQSFKWIYGVIRDYYLKYRTPVSIDVINLQSKNVQNMTLRQSIIAGIKEVLAELQATDLQYIKDTSIKFLKFQTLKSTIIQCVDILPSQNYEQIRNKINNAINAGTDTDLGKQFFEGFQARYTQTNRKIIPTPWPVMNQLMNGGLGRGQLGIVAAPPGAGKCIDGEMQIDIQYQTITIYGLTFYPWQTYSIYGCNLTIKQIKTLFNNKNREMC